MARKQKTFEGMEQKSITEIDDKAEVYLRTLKRRMKASKDEKADKVALIEAMKKHGIDTYRLETDDVVTINTTSNVRVVAAAEEGEADQPDPN